MRKVLTLILLHGLLTACGGSSSSGGGTANTGPGSPASPPPATSVAGTYRGSETVTFTIPGQLTDSRSGSITVNIDASGNVTIVNEVGVTFSGSVSGDRLTAQGSIQITVGGFACNGAATYEGAVSGNQVSGTSSGSANCASGAVSGIVNASGTFTAAKT